MESYNDLLRWGGTLVLLIVGLKIGLAFAARVAGDHAQLVLGMALVSVRFPTPPRWMLAQGDETGETDNRETPENTEETPGNSDDEPSLLAMTAGGNTTLTTRMTRAEHDELLACRHAAITLLDRCVKYYLENGVTDDGTIPRYDKIAMKSELRGGICDSLEYSGLVSKIPNKRTFVIPEIGSCAALMALIVANRKRVYPVGYTERQADLLAAAVQALPTRGGGAA